MSDTHVWPPAASTEAAFAEFAAHRDRLRALADLKSGGEREVLLAQWAALEQLEWRMRYHLSRPVAPLRVVASAPVPSGEQRREIGANTRRGLRRLAGNRGRQ